MLAAYGKIVWRSVPLPRPGPDQALIKVAYASICGSDEHVFRGEFHPRTRLPLIQGHEFAGTIIRVGKNVKKFRAGDRVAVDPIFWCGKCIACQKGHHQACKSLKLLGIDAHGGFGEYVAAGAMMLYKIPKRVPDRHAALVELFSIGLHACNRAGLRRGDTAAVFGAGKIGQAVLQAAANRTRGALFAVDVLEQRLEIARKVNPEVKAIHAKKEDPVKRILALTGGRGVDAAFEAAGHAQTIRGRAHPVRQCVQALRPGGTVCVLGLSDAPAPLVMKELIFKEAKIVASRVTAGEFGEAVSLLSRKKLKPGPLITGEWPASGLGKAFEMLKRRPGKHLKILIKPGV